MAHRSGPAPGHARRLPAGLAWRAGGDDDFHLTRPKLRSWDRLRRIWTEVGATLQCYPFLHTVFRLVHRLWGDATLGCHLTTSLVHVRGALLFHAGTLPPTLGFFSLFTFRYSLVANHYQYLARAGIITPVAAGLASWRERLEMRGRRAATVLVVLLLAGLATAPRLEGRQRLPRTSHSRRCRRLTMARSTAPGRGDNWTGAAAVNRGIRDPRSGSRAVPAAVVGGWSP